MLKRLLLPLGLVLSLFTPTLAQEPAAAQPAKAVSSTCDGFYQGERPPAIVSPPARGGQVFCRSFYALSYSPELRDPLWTSYRLTKAMADGGDNIGRFKGSFRRQSGLTAAQQGHHDDYNHTPFDRGHLTPANDAPDMATQRDTFVVSNIVPQISSFNSGLWRYLEASVHRLAQDEGEIYVVTGAVFSARPALMESPGRTPRIAVPDFTYKAIYVPSRNIAVGYIAANSETPNCTIISIADLTRQSGVDPFPALPAAVKATLPAFTLPQGENVPLPACVAASRRSGGMATSGVGALPRVQLPDLS